MSDVWDMCSVNQLYLPQRFFTDLSKHKHSLPSSDVSLQHRDLYRRGGA